MQEDPTTSTRTSRRLGNQLGVTLVRRGVQGAPTTYNKDFQEAWEALFDTVDSLNDCIRIATGVLSTVRINPERMQAGLSPDMLATDLAEYLVRKGACPATCCLTFVPWFFVGFIESMLMHVLAHA